MSNTPTTSKYQGFVSALFVLAVVLMATQYTVIKYGPAWVVVTPFNLASPDDIAYDPRPDPEAGTTGQKPGVFILGWETFDKVAYRLDEGQFLPPAEALTALLCVLALPLLFILGWKRQVWPRWPLWLLVCLAVLSLLGADHFKAAVREDIQLVLTCLAAYWLAGAAIATSDQAKRVAEVLGILTVVLVLLGLFQYYQFILRPEAAHELPTSVRATCASRTAYSGLMTMLLCVAFGRILGSGRKGVAIGWSIVALAGAVTLLNAGALIALLAACFAMAAVRGKATLLATCVFVPALLYGASYEVSTRHLDYLKQSVSFYHRQDGQVIGVEKRYLEEAASLNALGAREDVVKPPPDGVEVESLEVAGQRSVAAIGVGTGLNYQKAIGAYYQSLDNPQKQEPDTYNLFLLLAVQMGLFGAFAFAWILTDGMAVARRGYQSLGDPDLRALALGLYGVAAAILVFSLFGTVLIRGTGLLLFTLLGLAARLEQLSRPVAPPVPAKQPVPVAVPEPPAAPVVDEPLVEDVESDEPDAADDIENDPEIQAMLQELEERDRRLEARQGAASDSDDNSVTDEPDANNPEDGSSNPGDASPQAEGE